MKGKKMETFQREERRQEEVAYLIKEDIEQHRIAFEKTMTDREALILVLRFFFLVFLFLYCWSDGVIHCRRQRLLSFSFLEVSFLEVFTQSRL
jgi:hypothetical protein